jgi:exodeoxyribonuclease VIII
MKLETGIQTGITNDQYHADRKMVSSTWLKLIDKSPYHLRCYLDSPPKPSTPALIMGSAVDCLVFEPEDWKRHFIVTGPINRRTNAGREEWAALTKSAAETNRQVITEEGKQEAIEMANAIVSNPVMADMLSAGSAQQVFIWRDPVTGLLCKAKTDHYNPEMRAVIDLKTALAGDPASFAKAIHNFKYHVSAAFYMDGVRACGLPVDRFIFAVMEKPDDKAGTKASPELMSFYELDASDIDAGIDSYTSGLAAINFCMINNEWNGYTDQVMPISRPPWARRSDVESVASL